MKKIALFLILLLTYTATAQFSKTHYIPPLSGSNNVQAEEQFMYISTPSTTPINVRITQLGGATILGTVSRNVPYVLNIGVGNNTQLQVDPSMINTILNNKGYIVEADDVVYVSTRVIAGNSNQAGELVSKGLAALGTRYRIGAFTNLNAPQYGISHHTFVSILATENNTTVSFSDLKPGVTLVNNTGAGNSPGPIILNSGESFVMAVEGPTEANRDGLIGSLVTSDKPIAVNCGSFGGTNGELSNLDLGFDQLVSAERTGQEFIFIKSTGLPARLLHAHVRKRTGWRTIAQYTERARGSAPRSPHPVAPAAPSPAAGDAGGAPRLHRRWRTRRFTISARSRY